MPWQTLDPFLFCVHHLDHYPKGNADQGPAASLAGRNIGMDFEGKEGWRMYHGDVVPGFPQHPHRGFETVTYVRRGYVDHSDSLGATARYGHGDCQWMTAGKGIVHSEMFPLVNADDENPAELFQIWLNLPGAKKMVEPAFSMMWNESIPRVTLVDDNGRKSEIAVVAGQFGGKPAPPPPPDSWAARPTSDVAIWTLKLEAGAKVTLPRATAGANRVLFFFEGDRLDISGHQIPEPCGIQVRADRAIDVEAGDEPAEILLLQGQPIGEPIAQHGPFVMNRQDEIVQAFRDYQQTQFGGWPWDTDGPVHPRDAGRFAVHIDGRRDAPPAESKSSAPKEQQTVEAVADE